MIGSKCAHYDEKKRSLKSDKQLETKIGLYAIYAYKSS